MMRPETWQGGLRRASLLLWMLPVVAAGGENLYQGLVERAQVDDKALQAARKQIDEHQEVKVLDALSVPPFHQRAIGGETTRQPLCRTCHLALPHRSKARNRGFLNMHSRYIACETCHLQPKGVALDYRWLRYDGPHAGEALEVVAPPPVEGGKGTPSMVPQKGARIAPFYRREPALLFKDDPAVKRIAEVWKDGSAAEKARLKARLHAPLEKKGRACKACHNDKKSLLDWQTLGANPQQVRAITHNVIARFFGRYKKDDERLRMTDLLR